MPLESLWYSVAEVAARFAVHPDTIRRWIRSGELSATRVGRTIRIPRSELARISAAATRGDAA